MKKCEEWAENTCLGVVCLKGVLADDVGVHVDEGEEVEAHGRGEAAEHHAGEDEGVLVRLVVGGEVVEVEYSDGRQGRVRTQGYVRHRQGRYYLPKNEKCLFSLKNV